MSDYAAMDALYDELLNTEDEALRAARLSTGPAGMPAIEVSAQHGKLLSLYAQLTGARRALSGAPGARAEIEALAVDDGKRQRSGHDYLH